jgi:4'-phosphopantetheinyl transferase EntD
MIASVQPRLERALRRRLGCELRLAFATRPLTVEQLSEGERSHFARLAVPARKAEWLAGRAALKRLLARLGAGTDTAGIDFPNARVSLSHSGGIAVAAGVDGGAPRGVGVDLELRQSMDWRAARFFLSAKECSCVERPGIRQVAELLRLWTVKEALYKADPENRGRVLKDYRLPEPARKSGHAVLSAGNGQFRYASFPVLGGFLSVTVYF